MQAGQAGAQPIQVTRHDVVRPAPWSCRMMGGHGPRRATFRSPPDPALLERKARDIAPACTTHITASRPSVFIGVQDRVKARREGTVVSRHSSWDSRKLRYWAESSGQPRRAGLPTSHPAPAASPAQALLESRLLEQLGTSPDLCAHPFGIAALSSGTRTSLTLHLDAYIGQERYSFPEHCLSRLLPAAPTSGSDDDLPGIPGLRVRGIEARGRQLRLNMVEDLGPDVELVLALPRGLAEGWEEIERGHRRWCEDNGMRPLWTSPATDPMESACLNAYPTLERARARRSVVGSALLRRIAVFHTVAAFYRVQCWDDGDSWKIDARTAHPRAYWHDQLIQRLCHPRWGLPVNVSHRFCHCAEPYAPYQWGHTCSFYFGGQSAGEADPIYLRVHASPEGRDYDWQIRTLRQVGAPEGWMARALPQQAVQHHDQHFKERRRSSAR
ncbi:hypothetical protein ACFW9N_37110 [Streptomyces sp. NPDC059496]|uniref:hypothetical protein n=1 Tax=Streptomyces sp. NPDC059496 TaxID=3346851 RepID=UPI0036C212DC